ncbi:hypothetical protein CGCF415_v001176 [Colletotrichum fructicola]|uniref:GNAT family n=1 Tax=Colletotrichum fructicola (strain Nara gc5) TaxID=1213859 RepID=L2G3R7_COLFN|nr:uncharacterized protein CGMCC3_g6981 [Colletotrichum fructicola]KAF4485242.1 hypothetical protein CGGC5_v007624 [Colletotrichum fructicola Nara gc5]KAE9577267.1 hypothetical protein CGMCC3_g6981 [Colletotrichum fructicola]KAF4416686.1 putative N-acetyltransferase YafP [Colletotrichum fructicola]KAF4905361.1 hypothetical protein CGCFRS4_v000562 [Colletotrichum fructicola]KAF4915764.1 hypothetical protein CGCF415_v001176 [Colletotrichum fructicola]
MRLVLQEVKTDEEFVPLIAALREGFANPDTAVWRLFMGDWRPDDPAAREAALVEATERMRAEHRADPTSTWLKVIDDETGQIVAGGRWSFFERGGPNPYDGHREVEATWFPEGEPRWVASLLLNNFLERAVRNANRPHAFLNILFTIPEYRRRGAASLVMDWGVGRADCVGLDVYIEASEGGKPLYEKYGFEAIEESYYEVDERRLPPPRDVELRREAVKQLSPFRRWSMLRKARG